MGIKEYPKMVYGPKGQKTVINGPDEKPDGYMTYDEFTNQGFSADSAGAAAGAVQAAEAAASKKAAAETAAAREEAAAKTAAAEAAAAAEKDAEKEHRDALKARLDEHDVDYAPQLGTPKLEELVAQLEVHLASITPTEGTDGNGE